VFQNIKLLSSDIDGTLVDKSRQMKPEIINTIKRLKDHGYLFGLASGRPLRDVTKQISAWDALKYCDFIIAWNGCELWDSKTNQAYHYNLLKKEELKQIVEYMSQFDVNTHMYVDDIYLTNKDSDRAWYSAFNNSRVYTVAKDLSAFYQNDNGGIMYRIDPDKMASIEKAAIEFCIDKEYYAFKTQDDLLEFANRNSNKGYALKKICEIYNISLDETMAFGDTSNDNEMLKCCHGVCLVNGSEDTKACAEIITEKAVDEFGFIDFVDKYLL